MPFVALKAGRRKRVVAAGPPAGRYLGARHPLHPSAQTEPRSPSQSLAAWLRFRTTTTSQLSCLEMPTASRQFAT